VAFGEQADGLVWASVDEAELLREQLADQPSLRWIQLPFAGVENWAQADLFDDGRVWTCAKGSYAEPVAEHALLLALAGLRGLRTRIEARSWGHQGGVSLFEQPVTIVGGGGIAATLLRLLAPMRADVTVVNRSGQPVAGARRTFGVEQLHQVLPEALVVVLALALTPLTRGIIGGPELRLMRSDAWLVNVARGGHVDTGALVDALASGSIGGAALDVTDPEPLPDGHPLWSAPNCIITPHTADTWEMIQPLLARRIRENVAHLAAGEPLDGVIDPVAGY
jgi:phosphoglycerate dehydrogenase-like enzyme